MSDSSVANPAAVAARVEQFRKMAEADPKNELGHFSLGRALLDANQPADAIESFDRVIALNANISKVYQLKASAQLKLGQNTQAVETLQTGVKIANDRGDLMPKNDMIRMLKDLGADVPEFAKAAAPDAPVGADQVLCTRCGRVGAKLPSPPYRNAYGETIQSKICAACWREWIGMGTKVINELRLPLSDPQAQKVFAQHEREFLNL